MLLQFGPTGEGLKATYRASNFNTQLIWLTLLAFKKYSIMDVTRGSGVHVWNYPARVTKSVHIPTEYSGRLRIYKVAR